jgi:phosphorylcholine metabolism protein LicD
MIHENHQKKIERTKIQYIGYTIFHFLGIFFPKFVKIKVYSLVSQLSFGRSEYKTVYNDNFNRLYYDRNEFKSSNFKQIERKKFCKYEVSILSGFDYHLKMLYGDYMTMPDETDRKPEHLFKN